MTYYSRGDSLEVSGKISATEQASAEGDVPILNADGKLPGSLIPAMAVQFTIPASAWTGTGPYTASVMSAEVGEISTPIIGPDDPDGSVRETLAEAQITALSISAGAMRFVADGDKPSIPLNCVATGLKGTSTGHVISTFGAGGGSMDFFLNIAVTASAGTPVLSGISVVATPSTGTPLTGFTDSNGRLTLGVKQGMTYTVALTKADYTINPATSTVSIQDTSTTIEATCYEAPTLTVTCSGDDRAGRTVTCTADGETMITGTTNASGVATIVLGIATWSISVDYPTGQGVSPESATVVATAGGVYSKSFTILSKPVASITVVDRSSAGHQSGRTVTATPSSGTPVTGTTDATGMVSLTLLSGLSYSVSCDVPSGYVAPATYSISPEAGQTYAHQFDLYEEAQITVSVSPAAIRAGRTITASAAGFTPITATTNASGECTMSVPEGTWTIACDTPSGYFTPASQTQVAVAGQVYTKEFALDAKPVLTVTVGPTAAASGLLVRAVGDSTVTAYTNAEGVATLELAEDEYLVSVVAPSGYLTPDAESVTAVRNNSYSKTFTLQTKPTVAVTVTDSSSSGYQSGRTVTATNGTDTVSGVTGTDGTVTLTLNGVGTYTVSTDLPTGATSDSATITAVAGGTYTASLVLSFGFKFSMTLNATTLQTDPTGCLVYGDDAAGFTPLSNSRATLGTVTTVGSWGFSVNKLLKKMYYATFNADGTISKILDPDNLALDEDGNSSDITTKNTMFVIPKIYTKGETGKLTISDKSSEGTAHAHTIGGVVYDNLAIGVYNGYVSGSKLMSLSGVLPTKTQTRAAFRTQAQANGTNWMLWNYFQWKLIRDITFLVSKSFDGQRRIGMGGNAYGTNTTGTTNAMGPFAGDVSGTSSAMKALLEDWWGSQYQFIDDFYGTGGTYYAGKNAVPTDNTANKVNLSVNSAQSGYSKTILQGDLNWGLGNADNNGDNATGLCDGQWFSTSEHLGSVGGHSDYASSGYAGPSCLYAYNALSYSTARVGARLAFVFDN